MAARAANRMILNPANRSGNWPVQSSLDISMMYLRRRELAELNEVGLRLIPALVHGSRRAPTNIATAVVVSP